MGLWGACRKLVDVTSLPTPPFRRLHRMLPCRFRDGREGWGRRIGVSDDDDAKGDKKTKMKREVVGVAERTSESNGCRYEMTSEKKSS